MTPKEKAEQFIGMFQQLNRSKISDYSRIEFPTAKQCALIVIDEILNNATSYNAYDGVLNNELWADDEYWQEVKKEIEKL